MSVLLRRSVFRFKGATFNGRMVGQRLSQPADEEQGIESMLNIVSDTIEKFKDRTGTVGIVGMGYVGQPLALRYSQLGYKVIGFDIDAEKVGALNSGRSSIEHINDADIAAANTAGMECSSDFRRIPEADALILCVPTPLNQYREPDLSFVISTVDAIVPYLRLGQVLSLESTTYPGTTEEELLPEWPRVG